MFIVSTTDADLAAQAIGGAAEIAAAARDFRCRRRPRMLPLSGTPGDSGRAGRCEWGDVRERLVAWAEDCRVDGDIDLEDGRLSDLVNERDLLTFFGATLEAIEDGHVVRVDEIEVARHELSLIEVEGRRGDPERRLRTIQEAVRLEVGPFVVTGHVHRSPTSPPLVALTRWSRFVPVTEAVLEVAAPTRGDQAGRHHDVLLVNRDRVRTYEPLPDVLMGPVPDAAAVEAATAAEAASAAEAAG